MSSGFQLCMVEGLPCVVRGPDTGPRLLVIQPLFEEMNRTRRLLSQITARLAAQGIGSWMPDLPGTGDASGATDWPSWQEKIRAIHAMLETSGHANVGVLAVRGGALLANGFADRYLLAPALTGAAVLRDLLRTRAMASPDQPLEHVERLAARLQLEPLELAGYAVSPALAAALNAAVTETQGARVIKVGAGGIAGPPVWRQAEPADASQLADGIACDLTAWISTCASH